MKSKIFLKYPSVFTVLPLSFGILASYLLDFGIEELNGYIILCLLIIPLTIAIYSFLLILKKKDKFFFLYILSVFLFGFVSFQYHFYRIFEGDNNIEKITTVLKSKQVKIYGTVIENPEYRDGNIRLLIESDSIITGGKKIILNSNIFVTVYKIDTKNSISKNVYFGDLVSIKGELDKLPEPKNPGEFNYGRYLKMQGISGVFTSFGVYNIEIIGKSNLNFFKKYIINPVKEYSVHIIDTKVRGTEGEFLKGLVLGERTNIPKQMKGDFVASGVSHLIAVSGLNVAYVIIIMGGLLMFFPVAYRYKVIILLSGLFFYMNLTGNVPSIIRATIMASVYLIAQLSQRKINGYNIISFAALVILIFDPRELFDAGFILSFTAILSLAIFYPKLELLLSKIKFYDNMKNESYTAKFSKFIITLFLGTIAAQIGTLPITALMFKKISLVSFITNLVAIPVSNVALALGFAVIIFSFISNFISGIFVYTVSFLLHWLLRFINYFSAFDYSYIETYEVDYFLLFAYYALIFVLFFFTKVNYKRRLVFILLIIMNYYLFKNILEHKTKLSLSYLYVVDSKCCVITSPSETTVLLNTGTSKGNYNSAERNVIPYLKSNGIQETELVLLTSMDRYEFRNLIYFIKHFKVRGILVDAFYQPLFDNEHFRKYFKGIKIDFISQDVVRLFPDFKINIFKVQSSDIHQVGEPMILVSINYGENNFTFADEADFESRSLYEETSRSISGCSVLKVPLYGSFDFISPEDIVLLNPNYIVISSSDKVRKKYETEIFRESLLLSGYDVLKTGEDGAAIFKSDGVETNRIKWR